MNFSKLTDNLMKALDRYVYGPAGRALDSSMNVIATDKFMKLVVAPGCFALFALMLYSLFAIAKYENNNPCLEWIKTGEQTCTTHCVSAGANYSPPICNTNCSPKKECTIRQMADGTVQNTKWR